MALLEVTLGAKTVVFAVEADPMPTSSPSVKAASSGSIIPEDYVKMRDPFRSPVQKNEGTVTKSDLESYPVEDFKLGAVMTGPDRAKAMLITPDGKTFFVSEKDRIGIHDGLVRKITSQKVIVKEKILNAIGQEENFDSEILLPSMKGLKVKDQTK